MQVHKQERNIQHIDINHTQFNYDRFQFHSHSVVPGGFEVQSYSTREIPATCDLISLAIRSTTWMKTD